MTRVVNAIVFVCLAAVVAGCSAIYGVQHDYDKTVDFSSLKTFDWMNVPEAAAIDNLVVQRVQNAVDAELQARGLVRSSENPDVLIAEHLATKEQIQVENWGYGYGPWGSYWGGNRMSVYQYEEGSLVLDLVEPQSKRLIWRGSAKAEVDNVNTPEKSEKLINEAVKQILATFPPKP